VKPVVNGTTAALTRAAPYPLRLRSYLAERFPLAGHGLLIASYYSSNQFLAEVLTRPGEPLRYDRSSLLGAATLLLFFFHLRVFDEHKDFAGDSRHHPDRVLQRGIVTLPDLRRLGGAAIVLEAVLAGAAGPAAFVAWLAAFTFSLLMLEEFFAGAWLGRRLLLYAASHMLVMPLLAVMVFAFATGRHFWGAPGWFWLYSLVGFFVSFNWEISRKIRAPEEERAGVPTYTRLFGTYGAAWAVLAVRLVDTALVMLVARHLGLGAWFYWALVALYAVCLVGFLDYRLRTRPESARRMEWYAGMYIVAFDLLLAVELVRLHGLEVAW
jgi:4-hydroxybenzoate polyprenyltransferase